MTDLSNTVATSERTARKGVNPRTRRVKIEHIHRERQQAMQAINRHLAKEANYFSNRYLNQYKSAARVLDPGIWLKAGKKAIETFLARILKEDYNQFNVELLGQVVTHLSDHIQCRNQIYLLSEKEFCNTASHDIYEALIRGNLLQDFVFDVIADHQAISTDLSQKLKRAIRLLLRAITVLQFNILDSGKSLSSVGLSKDVNEEAFPEAMAKLGKIIEGSKPGKLLTNALKLVDKKLSKGSVRSSFVTWAYEYFCSVGGRAEAQEVDDFLRNDFPLIIEVAMTIMYYDNQILDQKGGIVDLTEIKQNLLYRAMLNDWCFEVIERKLSETADQEMVAGLLRKIFVSVDVGQYVDKNLNTFARYTDPSFVYRSLEKDLPNLLWQSTNSDNEMAGKRLIKQCLDYIQNNSFSVCFTSLRKDIGDSEDHLNLYLDRIFLTSSMLFLISVEIISRLTKFRGPEKDKVEGMIIGYSLSLQIINDYADFMPISRWSSSFGAKTVEKKSSDIFKDLENGTVSLPILIHLAKRGNKSLVYELLRKKTGRLNRIQRYQVMKEFYKEGTLRICELLSQSIARKAKYKYKIHRTNRASLFIRDLWSICFVNRYQRERTYIDQGFQFMQWLCKQVGCRKKHAKLELGVFDLQQFFITLRRKIKENFG